MHLYTALLSTTVLAASNESITPTEEDENSYLKASLENIQWFRDAKFGLFICWGPVTLTGEEIGWSRGGERRCCSYVDPGVTPAEEYDNLYKQFSPTKFDAAKWMALAKLAGTKYIIFLTKHHDGFCMFDTKCSDYNIMNSPFGRDVTKEIADACHKEGLKLGLYFSAPDWRDEDFATDTHDRFLDRFRGELRELCSNYGDVSILWFDLGWHNIYDNRNTFKMLRQLQPNILTNNRLWMPGTDTPGDFSTPEQRASGFNNKRPWESCMTMGTQWAWKPNDSTKSTIECLQTLIRCVVNDGNLALNITPNSAGEIEPLQVQRLEEIGEWLQQYGESIYSTRGGPFILNKWGGSTYRENKIYLHILDWREDTLNLPAIAHKVTGCKVLTGG